MPERIDPLPLVRPRRALALFDSPGGSVLLLTEALVRGIAREGCSTDIRPISEWEPGQMAVYQLLIVGAVNQDFGLSEGTQMFLDRTTGSMLKGKHGFAFDVRWSKHVLKSAGSLLEKKMVECGLWVTIGHAYALVDRKDGSLEAGAEPRFEELGVGLARSVW